MINMIDYNTILFDFTGEGELELIEDSSIKVKVNIIFKKFYNSEIFIELRSLLSDPNLVLLEKLSNERLIKCKLQGDVFENKYLEIPLLYINGFNFNAQKGCPVMSRILVTPFSEIYIWDKDKGKEYVSLFEETCNLRTGIMNFTFGGKHYTKKPDGSITRDFFNINIEDIEYIFKHIEGYSDIEKKLKKDKDLILTSELQVNEIRFKDIQSTIINILWLISYSQKTLVSRLFTELIFKDSKSLLIIHSDKKYPYSNSSFIDASHLREDDIELFLEESYPIFKDKKDTLKLINLFDIVCQAEIAKVLETKYLLLSTALDLIIDVIIEENNLKVEEDENLIDNFKGTIRNYFKNKDISLSKKDIEGLSRKLAYKTFKNKIDKVIEFLDLDCDDKDIKKIRDNRNKIVHEVRFNDYKSPLKDFLSIKLLIDKILLKKLNYSGKIINYSSGHKYEKII